jgi:hypothetical protein
VPANSQFNFGLKGHLPEAFAAYILYPNTISAGSTAVSFLCH